MIEITFPYTRNTYTLNYPLAIQRDTHPPLAHPAPQVSGQAAWCVTG